MSGNKVLLRTEDGKKVYILSGSDKKELMIIDESSNPPKVESFDLVPPGKMDNIDARIGDLDARNATLTNKALGISKLKMISESIGFYSNIQTLFAAALGCTVINRAHGSNHTSIGLSEEAEEFYAPCVGENSILYNNDLTNAAWYTTGCTVTKEVFPDGIAWNKVAKTGTETERGGRQDILLPENPKGVYFMADLYVPATADPAPAASIAIFIRNTTRSNYLTAYSNSSLTAGQKYRVGFIAEPAGFPAGWAAGDTIRLSMAVNFHSSNVPGTIYCKDIVLAFNPISVIEKPVATLGTAAAAGSVAWTKVPLNPFEELGYEAAMIIFGRNECAIPVSAEAHYRAYDKLIEIASRRTGMVLIGNPPPYMSGGDWLGETDKYLVNGYLPVFQRLMKKWNTGIDIFTRFLSETASEVMTDAIHQNATGSAIIVEDAVEQLNHRKVMNGAKAELQGKVRTYLGGVPTGTWTREAASAGLSVNVLLTNRDYFMVSATANDSLDFGSIEFQQLHIVTFNASGQGTLTVIIDDGTAQERQYTVDCSASTGRVNGVFVCDLGTSETHTVKVVNAENKTIKVKGIVAI